MILRFAAFEYFSVLCIFATQFVIASSVRSFECSVLVLNLIESFTCYVMNYCL